MLKVICDFCEIRPADNHFKVKTEIETAYIFNKWVNVDICKDCYQKLFLTPLRKEEK